MAIKLAKKSRLDPCGLKNKGNTCFFNASMQCFLSLSKIESYFRDATFDPSKQPMCSAFQNFILEYNNNKILDPSDFLGRIRGRIRLFDGRQQDAHAFLESLMSRLSDELDAMDGTKNGGNIIKKSLEISLEDTVKCQKCGFVSVVETTPTMQYLAIKESVQKSLDFFIDNEERVDQDAPWQCTKCGVKTSCPITHKIKSSSDYFIIYLNRFQSMVSKNNTALVIDERIHLNGIEYEAVGMVCHCGVLAGGHYYAYSKRGDRWFSYNDSSVEEAKIPEYDNSVYVIFYSRI